MFSQDYQFSLNSPSIEEKKKVIENRALQKYLLDTKQYKGVQC